MNDLLTIGHSTHSTEKLIAMLQTHEVRAVADVRSSPYSRYNPQFNRELLKKDLLDHRIVYVFLGRELGPRREEPYCYVDGKVRYDRIAETDLFKQGLERLKTGLESYRIALLCSEKDPIVCHRMILICRHLRKESFSVAHILEDGEPEPLLNAEERLLAALKIPKQDLFNDFDAQVQRAYDIQSEKIAHTIK